MLYCLREDKYMVHLRFILDSKYMKKVVKYLK